jgi:hypothetical protein
MYFDSCLLIRSRELRTGNGRAILITNFSPECSRDSLRARHERDQYHERYEGSRGREKT